VLQEVITNTMAVETTAQTAVERVNFLHQVKAANPEPVQQATPYSHRLYGQFLAGELTWEETCRLRDAAAMECRLEAA
jgi:hypothetical protein